MFAASNKGSPHIIEMLLKSGAAVNIRDRDSRTPLYNAVHCGSWQSVRMLVKAGADVNAVDNDGNTLLHASSSWFSARQVNRYKLLIQEGIKINVRNNHGFNGLTHALLNQQNYTRSTTIVDDHCQKKFAMLLFAAGDTIDEFQVRKVPDYLKPSAEINVMNICRDATDK